MASQITVTRYDTGAWDYRFRNIPRASLNWLAAIACIALLGPAQANETAYAQLHGELKSLVELEQESAPSIAEFYRDRNFEPAWLAPQRVAELQQLSALAEMHGLNPREYDFDALEKLLGDEAGPVMAGQLAKLDFWTTKKIIRLASHMSRGKVDPIGRYPELNTTSPFVEPASTEILRSAVMAESLIQNLNSLAPDTLLYRKMIASLSMHRRFVAAGHEWPLIPSGRNLETGMRDERVASIRERLQMPAANSLLADIYDAELAARVADFQARHLLTADGIVGRRTVAAMNVSIQQRINQLRVNLDVQRWANLPANGDYLLVNIPHFKLHFMSEGQRLESMLTQVGRSKRGTPVFKSVLETIVANPTWTVPPTIFREDVLPKVQTDPDYLASQNMYVVDTAGQRVDSTAIDWQATEAKKFPYRLRAQPGRSNALGRLKFQMPNPYLIYLHDTPARHLFARDTRTFSSGCIRLEKPKRLAEWLVERQDTVDDELLNHAIASKKTRWLGLDTHMPVIVMYATVDLNDAGEIVFAKDVYRNDRHALYALNTIPAEHSVSAVVAQTAVAKPVVAKTEGNNASLSAANINL